MNAIANWKRLFFTIWAGQAFSLVGSQVVHFAIAWWLTQETGSAAVLATMAIFGMLPQVILGPFIGALVDRWNRQRVMILADGAIALITCGMAVLFWSGRMEISFLYIAALLRGALGVFHWTAMQASTSLMVPKDQLARIGGMNQTLNGVLSIAAPPLGALVVGLWPLYGIMLIDVITAAIAITPLLFVRIPQPEKTSAELVNPALVWKDVRDGLRYVAGWPGLLIILLMATVINFLMNPTGTLMPLLITRHFNGGAWHLSALESSFSLGLIAGGILLSVWGGFKRRVFTSMIFLAVMGLGALAVGFTPPAWFWFAVGGNMLAGFANPLVNGPFFAFLQERIQPEMQGRVFTLVASLTGAISPLGMALAAPVADHWGIQVWWIIGGVACVIMGIGMLFIPAVARIEENSNPIDPAAGQSVASAPASPTG